MKNQVPYNRMDQVARSNIEIVQISIFYFIELSMLALKHSCQDFIMLLMIPKVNLGVGELEFIFYDLHIL